jgi:hypothetical protein
VNGGDDPGVTRIGFDFFAQLGNMLIQGAGGTKVIDSPDGI